MFKKSNLLPSLFNLLVGIIGVYYLNWSSTQVFFYIFLGHVLFIPFDFFLYHKLSTGQKSSLPGFILLYMIMFLLFALFFNMLLQTTLGYYDDFFYAMNTEFSNLGNDYMLPILGILILYLTQQIMLNKSIDWEKSSNDRFLFNIILKFFVPVPILILIAVAVKNIKDMPFDEELLVLVVYSFYEFFKPKLFANGLVKKKI